MLSRAFAVLLAFLFILPLGAQAPSFDVASLKRSPPPPGDLININLGKVQHGELTMVNVSLADILRFAFTISNDQQIAGPDWMRNKSVRFDILAKAPPGTPDEQIRLMLQTLIQERFKLAYHREPRELSYMALAIGKQGSKLAAAQEGAENPRNKSWPYDIDSTHMSMQMLVTVLSRFLREPILDETGLKGYYVVKLTWAPDNVQPAGNPSEAPAPLAATDNTGPSIFRAVQTQLGLKLESRKGKMDVLVIDHADQVPVEN
jgi:uncharacterized protein (TIGR03435 family)